MSLSCSCSNDYAWYFTAPNDYTVMPVFKRRKKCTCGAFINAGETCLQFHCYRLPKDTVEERIYGGDDAEVPMADRWFCERCGDLFFSFQELGFECVQPGDNMVELLADYKDTYGPPPKEVMA